MPPQSTDIRVIYALIFFALLFLPISSAQTETPVRIPATQAHAAQRNDEGAEAELSEGIRLTGQGRFRDAIPHLLAAQGRVSNGFAADFNLALCYVAIGQDQAAIRILDSVLSTGHATASVYNLLAQAQIGASQPEEAFKTFQQAVALDPKNEKLYLFLADSCMDHKSYELGLKFIDLGLRHLPDSARLHYQRGILLSFLDQPDNARQDLKLASKLAPGTAISFLAQAQEGLLNGDMPQAIRAAREGGRKEPGNYILLTILGQALIRQGACPGQPEFSEAQTALEKAVAERPEYSISQLALGQLELMAGHLDQAIEHLMKARQLAPDNPSVYSQLAAAYRQRGDLQEAERMLAVLAGLNRQQAAQYQLDPPDHKGSYIGSRKP